MNINLKFKVKIKVDSCKFTDLKPGDLFQWRYLVEHSWYPVRYLMLDPTNFATGQCIYVANTPSYDLTYTHFGRSVLQDRVEFRTLEKSEELDSILQTIIIHLNEKNSKSKIRS